MGASAARPACLERAASELQRSAGLVVALYHQGKAARDHPQVAQVALAKRVRRHQGELFLFLTVAGVEPANNAAERAVRPLVVARKVSGGTRSSSGPSTWMTLSSLVQTWLAKGLNPLVEVVRLLQSLLPQL